LKKEKISIISFYDTVISNSIQEHSISELYQYSNIHGYEFQYTNFNYIPERNIYFMKCQTIIDKLIEGLKFKNIDWILYEYFKNILLIIINFNMEFLFIL